MRPPALMAESRTGGSTALDAVDSRALTDAWTKPQQGEKCRFSDTFLRRRTSRKTTQSYGTHEFAIPRKRVDFSTLFFGIEDAWTSPGQGTSPKNRRSYTLKAFAELGIEDAS